MKNSDYVYHMNSTKHLKTEICKVRGRDACEPQHTVNEYEQTQNALRSALEDSARLTLENARLKEALAKAEVK